jgi:glyoxylase-like metal-dependent hydrolase (beta-lactamase superfamily II)
VNAYLVWQANTRHGLIIDPGAEGELLQARIEERRIVPQAILLTHAHPDHLGAVALLEHTYDIPVLLHAAEHELLNFAPLFAEMLGLEPIQLPTKINYFNGENTLQIDQHTIQVLLTPGHSPGSVCYLIENNLFSGDTLFNGSVGRVDLPGGSESQLRLSLKILARLPEETLVFPGHGEVTSIREEQATNPFLRGIL